MTTTNSDSFSPFDRQLGVATTRMDEHDRRLKKQEDVTEQLRQDLREIEKKHASFDTRLGTLEKTTVEIRDSLNKLVEKSSHFSGFLSGFKVASGFWYAVMTLIGGAIGYVVSKLII